MNRRRNRYRLLVWGAVGLSLALASCERSLGDSIEPIPTWQRTLLWDGKGGVDVREVLYVNLRTDLDSASVHAQTVNLFQDGEKGAALAVPILVGPDANVPGDVEVSIPNPRTGYFRGVSFSHWCDLYPETNYRLELIGLLDAAGSPLPDTIIHFRTAPLPANLKNPFYCDALVLPLQAYDLDDLFGISGGLVTDVTYGAVVNLTASGISLDPPTYKMIGNPKYVMGNYFGGYVATDNELSVPPYTVLVAIQNFSPNPMFLASTLGWFNLRPYQPRLLVDSFDNVDAWSSTDNANTPVGLEDIEFFEGQGGLRMGLNGVNSVGDAVSRSVGGFPAQATGLMFALKVGNVVSGSPTYSRIELRLTDSDGNVVAGDVEIFSDNINWFFFTRNLADGFAPVVVNTVFDPTQVNQIALGVIANANGNDLIADLFVDYFTLGDLTDLAVYYPPVTLDPYYTLPLYVDVYGSTYWAYNNGGLHTLFMDSFDCANNCPILDPLTALAVGNLAQSAP